jgi:UDP-N-acetylglucosamine:LPS N-acetylglucosamine transferase
MERRLRETLSDLLTDAEKRERMSNAVCRRASPDATEQVAEVIRRLAT